MEKQTFVHIRFSREEAKEYKRELLHAQLNLLRIMRALKNFKESRIKELDKKIKIYQELKEMRRRVKSLENTLPKPKIPKILKKEEKEEIKKEEETIIKTKNTFKKASELELQLQEIQEKLNSLK